MSFATGKSAKATGRWKSSQMPALYAKIEFAGRGGIARFKDEQLR